MGCCGNQRQKYYGRQSMVQNRVQMHMPISNIQPGEPKEVFFRYVGKTGLTVIGPISGIRYRFIGHGSILSVDPRDCRALVNVPNLKPAESPS